MRKLAFYLYNTNNQKALSLVEHLVAAGKNACIFKNISSPATSRSKVGIFDATDAYQFDGIMFTTCMKSTEIANRFPRVSKIIYIVSQPEWKNTVRAYTYLREVYDNPSIELWAENKQINKILSKVWSTPRENIDGYNHIRFEEALQRLE